MILKYRIWNVAAAAIATAVLVPASTAPVAASTAAFVVDGEHVTIHALTPPITVRLADLRAAAERIHTAGSRQAAQAALDSLPRDLAYAVAWERTNGVETTASMPPEEEVDRVTAYDPEPPVEPGDPGRGAADAVSANYTTPSPVCNFRSARDMRQMNSAIIRLTLYKFHMYAAWDGCDDGTNTANDDALDAYYSEIDPFFECTTNESLPSKMAGPYGGPTVRFRVSGQCFQHVVIGKFELDTGKYNPFIDNEYNWTGALVLRTGSAH